MKEILTNEKFIEIIIAVVPAIITGIITFLITKYSYYKNIPLDKLEIAYNRIYYPLYCLITSDMDMPQIIEKCELYLKKYRKYADRSTLKAFKYLEDNSDPSYIKKVYANFKENVYKINTKLRRRLGYLEPNIFDMYTSSTPSDKRMIRIFLELLGIYLSTIINSLINPETVNDVSLIIFGIAFVFLCIDIIGAVFEAIKKVIKVIIIICKK